MTCTATPPTPALYPTRSPCGARLSLVNYSLVPALRRRASPRTLFVSALAVLVVMVLFLPVELESTVEVPGRVFPAQEWVVVRGASGAVSATLRDYRAGTVEATFTAEPARGDAVRFHLGPAAGARSVTVGDTVGVFASGETAQRLAELEGQVEAARAELHLYQAGAKAPLVEADRQEVRRSQAALEQAQRVRTRQCDLFERGVVTEEACEAATSAERLAEAAEAAAAARLEATQTGARSEEIVLARTRLQALEREAGTLGERLDMETLVAPISGMTYRVFSTDTLLMVADTSSYTVTLPVRWSDRGRVIPGQEVRLRTSEWGEQPRARIVDLRETATRATGQAYLLAAAEVVDGHEHLTPGLLIRGAIITEPVTPLAYVQSLTRELFRW